MVIDIPSFGFNKEHKPNSYSDKQYFNYYNNIDSVCENLFEIFKYVSKENKYQLSVYDKYILYGHSTGGNILMAYVSRYYNNTNKKHHPFVIDRMLLNSPLTKLYFISNIVSNIISNMTLLIGYFSKSFDIRKFLVGTKQDNTYYVDQLNKCLEIINSDDSVQIDYRYKSCIGQPILAGFINAVNNETKRLVKSKNKIDLKTIVICSNKHGVDISDYCSDDTLNPDNIVSDIKEIIDLNSLSICQTNTGHDVLLRPKNNYNMYWKDFLKLYLS
jgi:alpha-beta hydrolase superfamily lysophospholipase